MAGCYSKTGFSCHQNRIAARTASLTRPAGGSAMGYGGAIFLGFAPFRSRFSLSSSLWSVSAAVLKLPFLTVSLVGCRRRQRMGRPCSSSGFRRRAAEFDRPPRVNEHPSITRNLYRNRPQSQDRDGGYSRCVRAPTKLHEGRQAGGLLRVGRRDGGGIDVSRCRHYRVVSQPRF